MARIRQEEGHDVLPVVFVGGEPACKRVFPGLAELEQTIDRAGKAVSKNSYIQASQLYLAFSLSKRVCFMKDFRMAQRPGGHRLRAHAAII